MSKSGPRQFFIQGDGTRLRWNGIGWQCQGCGAYLLSDLETGQVEHEEWCPCGANGQAPEDDEMMTEMAGEG